MTGRAGGAPDIIDMVPLHETGGRELVVITPAMKARAARYRGRQAGNAIGSFVGEVVSGFAFRLAHAFLGVVSAVCALVVTPGAMAAIVLGAIWGIWHPHWAAVGALWSLGAAAVAWTLLVTAKRVGIALRELEHGGQE
jgi:hypothetical protein